MATPNINPRADGEGQLGESSIRWGNIYSDTFDATQIYEAGSRVALLNSPVFITPTTNQPANDDNSLLIANTGWVQDHLTNNLFTQNGSALTNTQILVADSNGKATTTGSTVASLLDRANHTGTQAQSTIVDLVADLATLTANTGTNTSGVATNVADIATNVADIATNVADIATNAADIASIDTAGIATNTADIATNTADIATNTSDVADLLKGAFSVSSTVADAASKNLVNADMGSLIVLGSASTLSLDSVTQIGHVAIVDTGASPSELTWSTSTVLNAVGETLSSPYELISNALLVQHSLSGGVFVLQEYGANLAGIEADIAAIEARDWVELMADSISSADLASYYPQGVVSVCYVILSGGFPLNFSKVITDTRTGGPVMQSCGSTGSMYTRQTVGASWTPWQKVITSEAGVISGDLGFSGQLEATGQAATTDDSLMTRSLGDARFAEISTTEILVKTAADLSGVLDSTKLYVIDGAIDMGTQEVTVPATGLFLKGSTAGVSSLTSSEDAYTMFTSTACGDFSYTDLTITTSGVGSQVLDLKSNVDGLSAYNAEKIVYLDCSSLGELDNFRQGLEFNITRVGGSPSLTLTGPWLGGYRQSTTLVRALDAGMTDPLFKAGTGFLMNTRFITDMNCDLPALAALTDFAPANFVNSSSCIFTSTLISRDGVIDSDDTNLTPNIAASDLVCAWSSNTGLANTFVGGEAVIVTEVETVITTLNVAVDIDGAWAAGDLQHFDSPANGQLRHLGITPVEYSISWDFVLDGTANDEYRIDIIKDSGGVETVVHSQTRVINNLQGGRDVGFYTGTHHERLGQNDFTFWRVANVGATNNCTVELGSTMSVDAR